jgi:hypothetical protein
MSDFNTSKVDGNTVGSAEWNQLSDVDNLTTTSGQTPSTTDLFQLSIASARYSSGGQFFTDSGTANTYVLSPVSPFKSPADATNTYFNGMTIKFRAGNANSGASTVNINGAGLKNLKKEDGSTDLTAGDILTTKDCRFRYNGTSFVLVQDIRPATTTNQGVAYLNNPITIANNVASPNDVIDFGAGTFITSTGNQIYLPAITKKIQSSGAWTAGTGQNGLDSGARTASTFYRTYVIQNNATLAYDILFSTSATSPTVLSGYNNLGIIDYAFIRVNASTNIAVAKWNANNKRLVLGAGEPIQVFNGVATGAGNATILNTTENLEFVVRLYLQTASAGGSDIAVYGNEHSASDPHDCITVATNNAHQTTGGGSVYTSDGKIYWKNFSVLGGVTNQVCKIKSIKIRS